jgi:phenylacetate 2-hydroxylase
MPFVDLESYVSIKEILQQLDHSETQVDLDPYPLFQRLALNLSLTIGYGFRIDGSINNKLLREIVTVERGISTLRSTSNNWQDFIPLLRLFSKRTNEATDLRQRRDVYLENLLQKLKDRIALGTHVSCITGNILQDSECKLTHGSTLSCVFVIFEQRLTTSCRRDKIDLCDNDSRGS